MTTRFLLLRLVVIFELGVLAGLFVGCMEFLSSVSPQSPEASRALSVPGRGTVEYGRLPKDRPDLWPGQKLHRRGPFDLRNGALDNQTKSPWARSGVAMTTGLDLDVLLDPALLVLAVSYAVMLPPVVFLSIIGTYALVDFALHLPTRPMTDEESAPYRD